MGSRSSAPTATRALGRSGASAAEPRPHTCLGGALASGSGVSARLGVMRSPSVQVKPSTPAERACSRGFRATSGRVPVIPTLPLGRSKAQGPVSWAARECDFPHTSRLYQGECSGGQSLRSTLNRLAIQPRRKAQNPSPSCLARRGPPAMNRACFSSVTGSRLAASYVAPSPEAGRGPLTGVAEVASRSKLAPAPVEMLPPARVQAEADPRRLADQLVAGADAPDADAPRVRPGSHRSPDRCVHAFGQTVARPCLGQRAGVSLEP
jgi:hypothetical protein